MSDLIQWPRAKYWDKAWNPVVGCNPCSPACDNCYAAAWAKRFGQSFKPHPSSHRTPPRKGVVFCGNMTDLFGEWVFAQWRHVYATVSSSVLGNSPATYLWLTKRVACMANTLNQFDRAPNHYFGFTAESQEWFDRRMLQAVDLPQWANLWLSAEPLLGPMEPIVGHNYPFKWVVVGCESGPNRRPCKIEWVERIVEICRDNRTPVFVKQICLPSGKFTNKIDEFPKHLQIRQVPWATKGDA